jgi:chloride channel 3/4/5
MARTHDNVLRDEELYELTEDGHLYEMNPKRAGKYDDGSTIDWLREDSSERQRIHTLRSQPGARGILLPLAEASRVWFVVVMTGMGIGITGAWLDILVKWCVLKLPSRQEIVILTFEWVRLSDLREGHCSYGFFYNQVACCSGLDRASIILFKP